MNPPAPAMTIRSSLARPRSTSVPGTTSVNSIAIAGHLSLGSAASDVRLDGHRVLDIVTNKRTLPLDQSLVSPETVLVPAQTRLADLQAQLVMSPGGPAASTPHGIASCLLSTSYAAD